MAPVVAAGEAPAATAVSMPAARLEAQRSGLYPSQAHPQQVEHLPRRGEGGVYRRQGLY